MKRALLKVIFLIVLTFSYSCSRNTQRAWILNDHPVKAYVSPGERSALHGKLPGKSEVEIIVENGKPLCIPNADSHFYCKINLPAGNAWLRHADLSLIQPKILYPKITISDERGHQIPENTALFAVPEPARPGELPQTRFFYQGQETHDWSVKFSEKVNDNSYMIGNYPIRDAREIAGKYRISTYPDGIPATLELFDNGRFKMTINKCHGMLNVQGEFEIRFSSRVNLLLVDQPREATQAVILERSSPAEFVVLTAFICNPRTGDIFARL